MPKVLPAVGLAASALQLIEFVVSVFQKEHEVYQPRAGARIEHEHILRIVTHELYGLTEKIEERKTQQSSTEKRSSKFDDSVQQLVRLSDKTKEFTLQLIDGFDQAREKCFAGETAWTAPREALQLVWDKGNFNMHKKRFQTLRKEFDAALLRVLKYAEVRSLNLYESLQTSGLPLIQPLKRGRQSLDYVKPRHIIKRHGSIKP